MREMLIVALQSVLVTGTLWPWTPRTSKEPGLSKMCFYPDLFSGRNVLCSLRGRFERWLPAKHQA